MAEPLMPKATAVWLVDNTALTFDQIAQFCGLHRLEVQGIADGEVAVGIRGLDPMASGQVTREEIERCEKDPKVGLALTEPSAKIPARVRRARYTPVSKRQDRPNAISWLLKNYADLNDAQIGKLLGTTKSTISAVRDRTHWNTPNITPQDPLLLGLCSEPELIEALQKAKRRLERAEAKAAREARREAQQKAAQAPESATAPEAASPEAASPEAAPDSAAAQNADTQSADTPDAEGEQPSGDDAPAQAEQQQPPNQEAAPGAPAEDAVADNDSPPGGTAPAEADEPGRPTDPREHPE